MASRSSRIAEARGRLHGSETIPALKTSAREAAQLERGEADQRRRWRQSGPEHLSSAVRRRRSGGPRDRRPRARGGGRSSGRRYGTSRPPSGGTFSPVDPSVTVTIAIARRSIKPPAATMAHAYGLSLRPTNPRTTATTSATSETAPLSGRRGSVERVRQLAHHVDAACMIHVLPEREAQCHRRSRRRGWNQPASFMPMPGSSA